MSKTPRQLTRRERQIMDILFSRGRSSAAEILGQIDDPPSYSGLRTLLRVLEEKGHVRHEEVGRVYYYTPTTPLEVAQKSALAHLVNTFFDGSIESVVSTLVKMNRKIDPDEAARIARMIEGAARKGR